MLMNFILMSFHYCDKSLNLMISKLEMNFHNIDKQAGAELGQAQPELGIRLNCDLFKPGKLIIGLELGLNTIPGSTHVA